MTIGRRHAGSGKIESIQSKSPRTTGRFRVRLLAGKPARPLSGLLLGISVLLASCSSGLSGRPSPAQPSTTVVIAPSTGPQASTSTGPTKPQSLDSIAPCSLLGSGDLAAVGATRAPEENKIGTSRRCVVRLPDLRVVSVGLRSNTGLAQLDDQGLTRDITVGSHSGKEQRTTNGIECIVVLGVSDTSRVDVSATSSDSPMDALCLIANQVASIVEPKLP